MSEDKPPSSQSANKSWFERLTQMFQGEPQTQEELVDFIEDAEGRDLIDQYTKDMIHGVLKVSTKRVRDIMISRSQMVVLEKKQTVEQAIKIIVESAHSRFPVINEDKDNIEGILLAKDLVKFAFKGQAEDLQLSEIVRPCVIVPESKKVDVLLREFREERYHMAVVVDEYGGVSGLITIEDILEEIVGEIEDEFAHEEDSHQEIRKVSKKLYSIQALTPLADFNQYFGSKFLNNDIDTIGGLVTKAFGHLPKRGEETTIDGYQFKVTNADSRRLVQLQVKVPQTQVQN
ncbi:MAG: CBS domain-containing protein [Gammaproteobacteria bacterium]|nr:CBS domain-containing protein [Gammaproteobacteria bacterium]